MKYNYTFLNINNCSEYIEAINNNFVCFNYNDYVAKKIKKEIYDYRDESINNEYAYARFLYYNYETKDELYRSIGIAMRLAELNHVPSIHMLAISNLEGKTFKDEKEAFKLFKKASKKGFLPSLFYLGQAYFFGQGVDKNVSKGLKIINKVSKKGFSAAKIFLGNYYLGAYEEIQDYEKAFNYYSDALKSNNPNGYYGLANMYLQGWYVKKDVREAFKNYDIASSYEIIDATLMCAHLLISKQVEETDKYKAINYYKKAAYHKDPEGMYFYGTHLILGKDCTQDKEEGYRLINKAALLGNEDAQKIINGKRDLKNGN